MSDLKSVRDAVIRGDEEVEVTPDGTVRPVADAQKDKPSEDDLPPSKAKPTKLSKRVFATR